MTRESNSKSTNVWDYKPWWCQPWSIILTGITLVIGSWLLLNTSWITIAIAILIVVWWVYFLILYPRAISQYLISQPADIATEDK